MADLQSVQSVPSGLLELLGMKGSGKNPNVLDSAIAPVVDVKQLFGVGGSQLVSAATAAGAAPQSASVVVPANEVWLLHHANCACVNAGTTAVWVESVVSVSYGGAHPDTPVVSRTFTQGGGGAFSINAPLHCPFFPPEPLILGPGARITGGFIWVQPTTTTFSVSITAAVKRLS